MIGGMGALILSLIAIVLKLKWVLNK
jgi:hypothetical protein